MTEDQEHTADEKLAELLGPLVDAEMPVTLLHIMEKAYDLASERAGEPTMPTRADMIEAGEPILRQLFGAEYEKYVEEDQ